jgi:hypothetical protein
MRALHLHHIIFRSHQGSDAVTNLLATCWYHHVLIHAKLIRVWGLAGKRLVFEFLSAKDRQKVVERWETRGNDDTRRVEPEAEAVPAGAAATDGAPAGRTGVPGGQPAATEAVRCAE